MRKHQTCVTKYATQNTRQICRNIIVMLSSTQSSFNTQSCNCSRSLRKRSFTTQTSTLSEVRIRAINCCTLRNSGDMKIPDFQGQQERKSNPHFSPRWCSEIALVCVNLLELALHDTDSRRFRHDSVWHAAAVVSGVRDARGEGRIRSRVCHLRRGPLVAAG